MTLYILSMHGVTEGCCLVGNKLTRWFVARLLDVCKWFRIATGRVGRYKRSTADREAGFRDQNAYKAADLTWRAHASIH